MGDYALNEMDFEKKLIAINEWIARFIEEHWQSARLVESFGFTLLPIYFTEATLDRARDDESLLPSSFQIKPLLPQHLCKTVSLHLAANFA